MIPRFPIGKRYDALLFIAFLIGLMVILFSSLSDLTFENNGDIYSRSQRASLQPGDPVIQTFRAEGNGLSEIRVPIKNLTGYPDEKILLELLDGACDSVLHAQSFGYMSFLFRTTSPNLRFDPIKDSAGKDYCLRVTYFVKEKRKGEVPYLSASSDSIFAHSSYTNMKDGRVYDGRSLAIQQAYSSGNTLTDISTLIDRMSQYKPWFFKNGWLVIIFSISLLSTLVLFWYLTKLRNI